MTPILGIMASSVTNSITAYESIATGTVGAGGASNITFSNIPQTYKHLQLRLIAKSTRSDILVANNYALAQFNDDTGANYTTHRLRGDGSTVDAQGGTGDNYLNVANITSSYSSEANMFGIGITDIFDYTSTSKYKTTRTLSGFNRNGSGYVVINSNLWLSTAAVTKLNVRFDAYGNPFAQYSSFALYGIKG